MFKSQSLIEIRPCTRRKKLNSAISKSCNEKIYLPNINSKESDSNSDTVELIKHGLDVKDKINRIESDKKRVHFKESDSKTIIRPKEQIYTESMNVEKWIEVHKRRNKYAAMSFINKEIETSEALEILDKYNIADKKIIENLIDENDKKHLKAISIRQLRNLTLLDKVQDRLRVELNDTIVKVRKLESQREFNSIVARMRTFIDEIEDFKSKNSFNHNINNDNDNDFNISKDNKARSQLYEYDPFNSEL